MKDHPPKPFTPEWCELHPNQGQCPENLPIANNGMEVLTIIGIVIYLIIKKRLV
jgi:hypothetical protein